MDLQHLDDAIAYLQLVRNNKAQFDDIAAKLPRALLEMADRQEELSDVKRELAAAKAGRTQAMLDNERQHNEILGQLQPQIRQAQSELSSLNLQIDAAEKRLAEKIAAHEAVARGTEALIGQIVNASKFAKLNAVKVAS
jgi:flagellar biosynthesis chaperone FliJ